MNLSFLMPKLTDFLEIIFYAIILYKILRILKFVGVVSILSTVFFASSLYVLAFVFDLNLTSSIFTSLKDNWILIIVILFQTEFKTAISKIIQNDSYLLFRQKKMEMSYQPIISAVYSLSITKTGALIVFENKMDLSGYFSTGEILDAKISKKLLLTIFQKSSNLHDGAVIIKHNKIFAAKIYLPLSSNLKFSQKFGTRHMAALGITENSDSFVIVVSEETGNISFAQNGELFSHLSIEELSQRLDDAT